MNPDPGMGQAVFERTVGRPLAIDYKGANPRFLNPRDPNQQRWYQILTNSGIDVAYDDDAPFAKGEPEREVDYRFETWAEVADRVALGNTLLHSDGHEDLDDLKASIDSGAILASGRHLQHGDASQPHRAQSVYTNCSTASMAWSRFYLLLNGSGVGRSVDDDMLVVDWDCAPNVICALDHHHADFQWGGQFLSKQEAAHKYGYGERVRWHKVDDSREGWAQALEVWESMAYERRYKDSLLVLDFSDVRGAGMPIKGMQGRPSSGPIPTMNAFLKAATIKGAGMPRWLQSLFVEHYFSECVLVGGARRAAGIVTKFYRDPGIFAFIGIKMPAIYRGLNPKEIIEYRKVHGQPAAMPLWSSNHSVAVDNEFYWLLNLRKGERGYGTASAKHARKVMAAVTETAYSTGTGEPGLINVENLRVSEVGLEGWA